MENEMTIETLADEIEHKVNCMGNQHMLKLVEKLSYMHRTLLQSFVGNFIIPYVRKMAMNYKNDSYDERNKVACKMCSVMWVALVEKYPCMNEPDMRLPLI